MEKRAKINLFFSIVAVMLLTFLFVPGQVRAEDQNVVQLDFTNCSEIDTDAGRVTYEIEGAKYRISLYRELDFEQMQRVAITSNGMEIDLNAFSYYLEVAAVVDLEDLENPDSVLPDLAAVQLYLGETVFDLSASPRIQLQTEQFSGTVHIDLKKKDVAPPGPSYPDEIAISGTYDGFGMEIFLNGERIDQESAHIFGTGRGYASGDIYNMLQIQLAFGDGAIGSVTVNGTAISLPENVSDTMTFVVAPADRYDIVVTKKIVPVPRTIVWDSDKSGQPGWNDDERVKNGTVEILDVQDADGNSLGLKDVRQDADKNTGYANILPGSKVIFRLTPDYGYQLTSARLGDTSLTAMEEKSVFEYIMPDANVHIAGIFEKVENQAKSSAADVKAAAILLADGEISSGSVVLSVKDAELTDAQKANFEKAAAGAQIIAYTDLSLEQIVYKGTPDAVWADRLHTLQNKATVKLQLAQQPSAGEIVVIHEKQDGSYESLPAVYDAATQTVTFQTTGFSKYAIAAKKADTKDDQKGDAGKTDGASSGGSEGGSKDSTSSGGSDNGSKDSASSSGSGSGSRETAAAAVSRTAPETGDATSLWWPLACLGLSVLVLRTVRKRERNTHPDM